MISQKGIDFIKEFEGCRLESYPDPISGGEPWTIGWGQTLGIKEGMRWTQEQSDEDLFQTADKLAVRIWNKCQEGHLTPSTNQLAALTSFAYNLGFGKLLKLLAQSLRAGKYLSSSIIAEKMLLYSNANVKGEVRRRQAEVALFRSR